MYFDARKECKDECYTGLSTDTPGKPKHISSLSTSVVSGISTGLILVIGMCGDPV